MQLLTIGYEGLGLDRFFDLLHKAYAEVIVDVRQIPLSRKKGFSKSALRAAACERGFDYIHLSEFGCPKPIRDAYKADGDWARYTRSFLKYLEGQGEALDQLARLAGLSGEDLQNQRRRRGRQEGSGHAPAYPAASI